MIGRHLVVIVALLKGLMLGPHPCTRLRLLSNLCSLGHPPRFECLASTPASPAVVMQSSTDVAVAPLWRCRWA